MADIDYIKEKMDGIEQSIIIYKNDIKRFEKQLKEKYGIKEDEVEDRLSEIEEELDELRGKRKKLIRKVEKELDKIDE